MSTLKPLYYIVSNKYLCKRLKYCSLLLRSVIAFRLVVLELKRISAKVSTKFNKNYKKNYIALILFNLIYFRDAFMKFVHSILDHLNVWSNACSSKTGIFCIPPYFVFPVFHMDISFFHIFTWHNFFSRTTCLFQKVNKIYIHRRIFYLFGAKADKAL